MGESMCPLSSSSTLEMSLNPVRDIQNENIVRNILSGAFPMGYLSKCFMLNTWMSHHTHNRFDLSMKGISPTHPFSSLYSLCICICFHVFLCANINSQTKAGSLKPTWKTPGFLLKLYYSTNAAPFNPVSSMYQSSFHPCIRAEDNELYPVVLPFAAQGWLLQDCSLTWGLQNWGFYVLVFVITARDRLCVCFHRSPWSVKKIPHCSKSLVWFLEQHLFLNTFFVSTQFEFKRIYWWEKIVIAVRFSILKCFKWQ